MAKGTKDPLAILAKAEFIGIVVLLSASLATLRRNNWTGIMTGLLVGGIAYFTYPKQLAVVLLLAAFVMVITTPYPSEIEGFADKAKKPKKKVAKVEEPKPEASEKEGDEFDENTVTEKFAGNDEDEIENFVDEDGEGDGDEGDDEETQSEPKPAPEKKVAKPKSLNAKKKAAAPDHADRAEPLVLGKKYRLPSEKDDDKYHIDAGTTFLNAYKALSPNQITSMTKDTQDLMETQKQLMGTLSTITPLLNDGQKIMGQFQQFFGKGNPISM